MNSLDSNVADEELRDGQNSPGRWPTVGGPEDGRDGRSLRVMEAGGGDETSRNDAIRSALGALPPALRAVAEMRFLEDATYEAISQRLAISPVDARKRVAVARKLLTVF